MTVKIEPSLKRAGFTLIEMLLVIAIIGVLTTMAISTFQKRSESSRVDKSALQIQQLLQAALAYQVANNKWPNYPATNNSPDFSPYIPVSGETGPWGYNYTWQSVANGNKFQLQAQTPDFSTAQQLAAKLPNAAASADGSQGKVITEVALPGNNMSNTVQIMRIGEFSTLDNPPPVIPIPACPNNGTPEIFFALNYLRTDKRGPPYPNARGPSHLVPFAVPAAGTGGVFTSWILGFEYDAIFSEGIGTKEKPANSDNSSYNGDKVEARAFYMVVCVPNLSKS